jgi:IPT/TIG domain
MAGGDAVTGPTITSLKPARGTAAGGTQVRIVGTGLTGTSSATFGGVPSKPPLQIHSDSEIVVTTPPSDPGDVDVTVTVAGQTATARFHYAHAPVIHEARLTRKGDGVEITGDNLTDVLSVSFTQTVMTGDDPDTMTPTTVRSVAGHITHRGAERITAIRPPGPAGPAGVVVTTTGGASQPFTVAFPVSRSRIWIFVLALGYLVALLAGMVVYLRVPQFPTLLPDTFGPVPLVVPWFGALGAVLLSMYGVLWHRGDWDPTYTLWHVVRPVMGIVLGTIAYLLLAAGVVASGGVPQASLSNATTPASGTTGPFNNIFYDLVAFLVGFRESTFRVLIQRLADIIASPGSSSNSGSSSGGSGSASGSGAAGGGSSSTPASGSS